MGISFRHHGSFKHTEKLLDRLHRAQEIELAMLDKYGRQGLIALEEATPKDTGRVASSWYYEIYRSKDDIGISFNNSDIEGGCPIAIILQYGHGTRNGGYVQGRDYINPAIQPIFDRIAEEAWREVFAS